MERHSIKPRNGVQLEPEHNLLENEKYKIDLNTDEQIDLTCKIPPNRGKKHERRPTKTSLFWVVLQITGDLQYLLFLSLSAYKEYL
jgi:hypothetical protein